jgi:RNA polymerase sigma-70 factor (ECF subfamily)
MDTPASLLERLRRPVSAEAWARFVDLYTPLLYYWARRAGLQEADAADLVQDVLVVLFQKLPEFTYDRGRSFRSWLRTVTLNKWRERRRRQVPVTGATMADVPGEDALDARDEQEYCRHLVRQTLENLRPEFPATTWTAFQEYVIAGRPAAEVAQGMGVRLGTIYAAKSRVLARVRRELEGLLDE